MYLGIIAAVRTFNLLFYLLLFFEIQLLHHLSRAEILSVLPDLEHKNSSIYLSYANNPFGSAKSIDRDTNHPNAIEEPKLASRSKRGVLHLYSMVSCATGCDPLKYKGYGCYCGFLGSGYAVDGIDSCCKLHDWCYNSAGCPMFLEYFVPYYWKCWGNRPFCALAQGEWGSCAYRLCECDRLLSECLRKYPCPETRAFCTSSPLRLFQNALMLFH